MAQDAASSPLITGIDDLEATFHAGAKPRDAWRIGVEYEKPVVDARSGEAVPYDGERGIGQLLQSLHERFPQWNPVREGPNIIALEDETIAMMYVGNWSDYEEMMMEKFGKDLQPHRVKYRQLKR